MRKYRCSSFRSFEIAVSFHVMAKFYDAYKINYHQFSSALSKYATKENKSILKAMKGSPKSFIKLLNKINFMNFPFQSKLPGLESSRVDS